MQTFLQHAVLFTGLFAAVYQGKHLMHYLHLVHSKYHIITQEEVIAEATLKDDVLVQLLQ